MQRGQGMANKKVAYFFIIIVLVAAFGGLLAMKIPAPVQEVERTVSLPVAQ